MDHFILFQLPFYYYDYLLCLHKHNTWQQWSIIHNTSNTCPNSGFYFRGKSPKLLFIWNTEEYSKAVQPQVLYNLLEKNRFINIYFWTNQYSSCITTWLHMIISLLNFLPRNKIRVLSPEPKNLHLLSPVIGTMRAEN